MDVTMCQIYNSDGEINSWRTFVEKASSKVSIWKTKKVRKQCSNCSSDWGYVHFPMHMTCWKT